MKPLSKDLNGELRMILKEVYGKDVSESEAEEIGTNLVRYFDLLAQIEHREEQKPSERPP